MKHIKKILGFVMVISLLLMFGETSYSAQNVQIKIPNTDNVCFTEADASRLVVELEKGRIIQQNLDLLEKSNVELAKQNQLLSDQIKLTNEELASANNLLKTNEDLNNQKVKNLNDQLKQAEKTRWASLFESGGVGVLVGVIVTLLLVH